MTLKSFSEIYRLFKEVVARVGIREPELYIYNDPEINAYTYGETNTFVAISSGAVERMNKDELKGILAHECGHILCKHTLYMTIWRTLQDMGALLGWYIAPCSPHSTWLYSIGAVRLNFLPTDAQPWW